MCSQETTHSNNMNQKNNLVKNASFLMIAAMISKVIGLLYKSRKSWNGIYKPCAERIYDPSYDRVIQYSTGCVKTNL